MEIITNFIKRLISTAIYAILAVLGFALLSVYFVLKLILSCFKFKKSKKDKYLLLKPDYDLSESTEKSIDKKNLKEMIGLSKKNPCLYDVLKCINNAKNDKNLKGIILKLDEYSVTKAHTGEIIKALKIFKTSGKKVRAYGSIINNENYFAATAADEIVLDPSKSAQILIKPYGAAVPYFKDAGDKAGIKANVIHLGKYKGTGENYCRSGMSDEYRKSITGLLEDISETYIRNISESRGLDENELKNKISSGEFVFITPEQAVEYKLADRLSTYDEFLEELKILEKDLIDIKDYESKKEAAAKSKIAVIYAEGTIYDSDKEKKYSVGKSITPDSFEKMISKIIKGKNIKAAVLRVNSPGGSALASEKIYRMIAKLKEKMPVIASFGPYAASGGYYIACGASQIYAEPNSITGSVGVVSILPNISGFLNKIGINTERISGGKHSNLFDPTKSETEEDIEILTKAMSAVYDEFKQRVSDGRKLSDEKTEELAQGKIWTGRQAVANGLADKSGGLLKAIEGAAELADIKNYQTVFYPKAKSLTEKLLDRNSTVTDIKIFKTEFEFAVRSLEFAGKPALLLTVSFE